VRVDWAHWRRLAGRELREPLVWMWILIGLLVNLMVAAAYF
jgi:hypothetical protein